MKEQAIKKLDDMGLLYELKNDGNHVVIDGPNGHVDYWPTTGKWRCRHTNIKGQGWKDLEIYLTPQENVNTDRQYPDLGDIEDYQIVLVGNRSGVATQRPITVDELFEAFKDQIIERLLTEEAANES